MTASLSYPPFLGVPRTLDDIYGPGVAVCARPALEAGVGAELHRNTRDVFSARPLAVAGDTPLVCSAGGTDPELVARLRDSGLPVGSDLRVFGTEAEFEHRVREVVAEGLSVSTEYPQPTALCPDGSALKTGALVGHLNNKASIATLVSPEFQARRVVVPRSGLSAAAPEGTSWVLKAATDHAHGGSLDVYLHRAGRRITPPAFTKVLTEFVVEEYLTLVRNWGVQLYVGPDGVARLLAVTEQRVDGGGVYAGGKFGAVTPLPTALLAECVTIAQRAADLGYRGMCSLDCARAADDRLVVLDLNFRITSGSLPLLALRSIRPDALDQPAESVKLTTAAPIAELLGDLAPALAAGGLLIIAGHDSTRTDSPVRLSTLQLLVFGDDPDEVAHRRAALENRRG